MKPPAGSQGANATFVELRPYKSWLNNKLLNSGGEADETVPESCCLENSGGSVSQCNMLAKKVNLDLIYDADCFDAAAALLDDHVALLLALAMAFGLALVLAAALAICLYFLVD